MKVIERQRLTERGKGTKTWRATEFERVSNRYRERNRQIERRNRDRETLSQSERDRDREWGKWRGRYTGNEKGRQRKTDWRL